MDNSQGKLQAKEENSSEIEKLQEIEQELSSIDPQVTRVLKNMNKQQKQVLLQSTRLYIKQHSGPIPDPESVAQYNLVIPNGGDRLMTMAEKKLDYEIKMGSLSIRRASAQHLIGQIFGFVLASGALVAGYFLTINGFPKSGIAIFSTTIAVILYSFVLGKRKSE